MKEFEKKIAKIIVELHYGLNGNEPHTLSEISEELNIPMERLRQIELKVIDILIKARENE